VVLVRALSIAVVIAAGALGVPARALDRCATGPHLVAKAIVGRAF
jgi:hypothetical protein